MIAAMFRPPDQEIRGAFWASPVRRAKVFFHVSFAVLHYDHYRHIGEEMTIRICGTFCETGPHIQVKPIMRSIFFSQYCTRSSLSLKKPVYRHSRGDSSGGCGSGAGEHEEELHFFEMPSLVLSSHGEAKEGQNEAAEKVLRSWLCLFSEFTLLHPMEVILFGDRFLGEGELAIPSLGSIMTVFSDFSRVSICSIWVSPPM
jgi:hypothetical protein